MGILDIITKSTRYPLYPSFFYFTCISPHLYHSISSSGCSLFAPNLSSPPSKSHLLYGILSGSTSFFHSGVGNCCFDRCSDYLSKRSFDLKVYANSAVNEDVTAVRDGTVVDNCGVASGYVVNDGDNVGNLVDVGEVSSGCVVNDSDKVENLVVNDEIASSCALNDGDKVENLAGNGKIASSCVADNGDEVEILVDNIVDIIRSDMSDMELRLESVGSDLSKLMIIEILQALNRLRVPALRFFEWARGVHPGYCRNSDICSLAVDNCGRLGDYTTMLHLLKDFRTRGICLTKMAFGFLDLSSATPEVAQKSIVGVIGMLNEIGGSCRSSGIHSLVSMLCSLNLVDLAKFVTEITDQKLSYYRILVKHMCANGRFEDVRYLFEHMRISGCSPDSTVYNYLISSLCMQGRIDEACSIPNEMLDRGCSADELTFELLIYFCCRSGRADDAIKFRDQMISRGIRPYLRTHKAFIKGYVNAQRFNEAYQYAVDTAAEDKLSAEHLYNVLASHHIKDGDLVDAHKVLVEMIDKGLKPRYSVCRRAAHRLHKTGRSEFAKSLKARYSSVLGEVKQSAV